MDEVNFELLYFAFHSQCRFCSRSLSDMGRDLWATYFDLGSFLTSVVDCRVVLEPLCFYDSGKKCQRALSHKSVAAVVPISPFRKKVLPRGREGGRGNSSVAFSGHGSDIGVRCEASFGRGDSRSKSVFITAQP